MPPDLWIDFAPHDLGNQRSGDPTIMERFFLTL